jgi:hypothetical protein
VTLDWFWLDEGSKANDQTWPILEGRVLSTKGDGWLTTTPGGPWVKRMWKKTTREGDKNYAWFRFATADNPHNDPEEIARLRAQYDEKFGAQELDAEFIDDSGVAFPTYERSIDHELVDNETNSLYAQYNGPMKGHSYVIAADLAKIRDYTVVFIIDTMTRGVVGMARFARVDWDTQVDRISAMASDYAPAKLIVDSTGLGEPICDALLNRGLDVEPVNLTGMKERVVNHLAICFDAGVNALRIPNNPQLIRELDAYEYVKSPTGRATYAAATGEHDDCVIALALGAWGMDHYTRIASAEDLVPEYRPHRMDYGIALPGYGTGLGDYGLEAMRL